jgi:hypothetical protein
MSNFHQDLHHQPERGYDIIQPVPEPPTGEKSEYAHPEGAKHNPSPQMFYPSEGNVIGKPIYSADGTIDGHPEAKPSLNPSPVLAIPTPVLAPSGFETSSIVEMLKNSPSMQPLSEARLEQLRLMGKQGAPAPEESIDVRLARLRFGDAEVEG